MVGGGGLTARKRGGEKLSGKEQENVMTGKVRETYYQSAVCIKSRVVATMYE